MAKRIYFTSNEQDAGYTFEEYKTYLMECQDIPKEELPTEENCDYYNWAAEMVSQDLDDLFENLKYSKYNTRCYVTGSVGLWYGREEIVRTYFDTLDAAIRKCLNGQDNAEIKADGNAVYVYTTNHDSVYHGGNDFKIVIVGKKIKGGYLY